jgi:hypothetical protein
MSSVFIMIEPMEHREVFRRRPINAGERQRVGRKDPVNKNAEEQVRYGVKTTDAEAGGARDAATAFLQ